MFDDYYNDKMEAMGAIGCAALAIVCPPALAAIYIAVAVSLGRDVKAARTKEEVKLSRCETKNSGSNTIGFVYTGEVR